MSRSSSKARLSVVVPAFNRQDLVNRAIDSIFAQELDGIEVILVDDGSPEPLTYVRHPVQIIRHKQNCGAAAARNTGMSHASGEWIAFLDSDDVWLPGTLAPRFHYAQTIDGLDRERLTVHVAGFVVQHGKDGKPDIRIPRESADPLDFASGCWFAPGSTALFRREPMLSRVGMQDESFRRFEDNDWFLRFALAGGAVKVCHVIAAHISVTQKPPHALVNANARLILEKARSSIADAALREAVLRRLSAWWALERASSSWYAGDALRTFLDLSQSFLFVPRVSLQLADFWQRGEARLAANSMATR